METVLFSRILENWKLLKKKSSVRLPFPPPLKAPPQSRAKRPCSLGIGDASVSLRRQSCKIMKIRLPCRHAQTPLSLFPSTDLTSWTVRSRCATKRQMQPTSSHTQPGSAVVQQTGGAKPEELERFNTAEHSRLPWPSPRSRVDPISRARQDGLSRCTTLCDIGENRTISNQSNTACKTSSTGAWSRWWLLVLGPKGDKKNNRKKKKFTRMGEEEKRSEA